MRQIGYRVHVRPEWVVPFIGNYGKCFQIMQVRATEKFMKDVYIKSFIEFCESMGVQNISFHLANVFNSEQRCGAVCDFLSDMEPNSKAVSVAYFIGENQKNVEFLHVISRTAKDNSVTLALENISCKKATLAYMSALKWCAIKYGFKVCIDVGTLFHSARGECTDEEIISYFKNDFWWRDNVVLIHLHDYNAKECLLNFGDGYFGKDFKPLKRLLQCFDEECPIVFKTAIQDISSQGVIETKAFLELWEDTEV